MVIKILILLKEIDGGTGTYLDGLLDIKKLYVQNKLDIRVLVVDRPKYRKINSGKFVYFSKTPHNDYRLKINNINIFYNELIWFKKNINDFIPDIVLASNFHAIFISEISRLIFRLNYKTISLIQNNLFEVFKYRIPIYLNKFAIHIFKICIRKTDCVVTVSEKLSHDIQQHFKLNKSPLTVPITMPFKYLKKPIKNDNFDSKVVVCQSRLDDQKDVETIIRAIYLIEQMTRPTLWIIGDGPNKNKLKKLTNRLGLKDKVKFFGWVQNPLKLLRRSTLFVLSSRWEGFPLSIIEAMSLGIPVVSTNCKYGPSEIIEENKYGLLVKVKDAKMLACAIQNFLDDYKIFKHYSRMSLIRVRNYRRKEMLTKYKDVINKLLLS